MPLNSAYVSECYYRGKLKGKHTMTLQILGTMDGRKRGYRLRDEKGRFVSLQGREEVLQREVARHKGNLNFYQQYAKTPTEQRALNNVAQAITDDANTEMRLNRMSRPGINARLRAYKESLTKQHESMINNYRASLENQGIKGRELKNKVDAYKKRLDYDGQVARYKEGLMAERKTRFNQLKGKRLAREIGKNKSKKLKVKPKKTGLLNKIAKFFKGKKGIAAAAGVLAAAAATTVAVKSCGNEDKPAETVTQPAVPPQDTGNNGQADDITKTTEQSDSIKNTEPPKSGADVNNVEQAETPFDKPVYVVQKGDSYWKIAEQNLIHKHKKAQEVAGEKVDENYKPTDKEILEETKRLIKGNNSEFDKEKWDTNPKLKVGDKINIAA